MKKIVIAYVPVLHDGYFKFFKKHSDARAFYLFGDTITQEFDYLKKDIRALSPELVKDALLGWNLGVGVYILDTHGLEEVQKEEDTIIMPDEDVSRELSEKYFKDRNVVFDSIFLRWDKHNSVAEKPVNPDITLSKDAFDKEMIQIAEKDSTKSSDFWRHVGAAVVKDNKIISVAHNTHVPSEHMPYVHSDPRNAFKKGVNMEISTVIHAEAKLIAEAAEKGIPLRGASMYVTTFPCPACAKLIAYSGIKKIYAAGGYAVLDGESILKSKGVEIVFVETDEQKPKEEWRGYSKK